MSRRRMIAVTVGTLFSHHAGIQGPFPRPAAT